MKTLTSMTDFILEQRKMHQGDFEDYADYKKIEDLVRYNLQLTKTALKEIGL